MKIQDSIGNFTPLFEQNKPIVIQKSSWLKHLEAELKRFNREKADRGPLFSPRRSCAVSAGRSLER